MRFDTSHNGIVTIVEFHDSKWLQRPPAISVIAEGTELVAPLASQGANNDVIRVIVIAAAASFGS